MVETIPLVRILDAYRSREDPLHYIKKIFKLVSNDELNMYRAALKDIKTGKLGMHEIYRPGWKFSN